MNQTSVRLQPENPLIEAATPLLQLAMRLQSGDLKPSSDLRRSVTAIMQQFEQTAAARGYKEDQMQQAKFALAALLDEVVLASGSELRVEWEKYPLQLEYFHEAFAGTKFFDRVQELLKRVEAEADVIEVYYLCLLLGFKGKYAVFLEEQLPGVINNVAEHLRRAGRLRGSALSPHWRQQDQPPPPPRAPELPRWVVQLAVGSIGLVLLLYTILNWLLIADVNLFKQGLVK